MPIITIESLQKQVELLKSMNEFYSKEINKLNTIINVAEEEKKKYIIELDRIKVELQNSKISGNDRNAGRKGYSNKEVINKIYSMYIDNLSLQKIAEELNGLNIKTNIGKSWSKSSIRFILLNHKNIQKGFIDEKSFLMVKKLLEKNNKGSRGVRCDI